MTRLPLALACSALATFSVAHAQNYVVFPSDHADQPAVANQRSIEGSTYTSRFPFSYGLSRCQFAIDHFDLGIPNGRQISRIGFDRNGTSNSTGTQIQVEIKMVQPTVMLGQVSSTFANNYTGGTPATVFNQQILSLPNLGGTLGVEEFFVMLDTPYTYDDSRVLITEFVTTATAPGNGAFNYYLDVARALVLQRSYGSGCTNGTTLPTLRTTATKIGGNWTLQARSLIASAGAIWLVGFQSFEPGISLDPIGLVGCYAHVDPVVAVTGLTTNTSGSLNLSFGIPSDGRLIGAQLYSQVAAGNVFGLSMTNGDEMTVTTDPVGVAVVASGTGSPTASTGSVTRNYGLITYFEHN